MSEEQKKYHCFECNKYYKSRSSLSHHRRRYHNILQINVNTNVNTNVNNVNTNVNNPGRSVNNVNNDKNIKKKGVYKCEFCQKIFAHRQSKYLHKKAL